VQKLGLDWACKRFCIGKKLKACNVLLWVWKNSGWMKEKERWQNLDFCFVKIERVSKKKAILLKMLGILESGSKAFFKKGAFKKKLSFKKFIKSLLLDGILESGNKVEKKRVCFCFCFFWFLKFY
jgi:hypothetical protein